MNISMNLTLRGRIPSLKNSKMVIKRGGKTLVLPQKRYKEWLDDCKNQMIKQKIWPLDWVFFIHYKLYYPDLRIADHTNKLQSVEELFVKYWMLEDDNRKVINKFFVEWFLDREDPRIEVKITEITGKEISFIIK